MCVCERQKNTSALKSLCVSERRTLPLQTHPCSKRISVCVCVCENNSRSKRTSVCVRKRTPKRTFTPISKTKIDANFYKNLFSPKKNKIFLFFFKTCEKNMSIIFKFKLKSRNFLIFLSLTHTHLCVLKRGCVWNRSYFHTH